MKTDTIKKQFGDKSILILGLGREGLDNFTFFRRVFPKKNIGLADKTERDALGPGIKKIIGRDKKITLHLGPDYLKSLPSYDVIVKSPGIPIHLSEIEAAAAAAAITTQTRIFFQHCPGTIIGITGTKGKSTTSSLIYAVLKKAKKRAKLLGNIGSPILMEMLKAKKGDYFVLELSSHQLYGMDASPHIAVLLNIYREHLDYYRDFEEYAQAKANIAIHQKNGDYLIYNSADSLVKRIAESSPAKKIAFNEYAWDFPQEKMPLIGAFNFQNAKVAAIVGSILKIGDAAVKRAIAGFKPLEHRLELTGVFKGIAFYNDSLSTIQESAVAAIDGLGERVETLIAGGFDRQQPFGLLAEKIISSNIKTLILFPTTGGRIALEVEARLAGMEQPRDIRRIFANSMDEAVAASLEHTAKGKICLMSCASSSFSVFKNYEEKGAAFRASLKKFAATGKKRKRKTA